MAGLTSRFENRACPSVYAPLRGIRRQPGRLALVIFRLPLPLYHRGWGRLLGHTFLVLVHAGRKTGKRRSTAAMVLRYDPKARRESSARFWGQNTDWIRNIRVRPALQVIMTVLPRADRLTRTARIICGSSTI